MALIGAPPRKTHAHTHERPLLSGAGERQVAPAVAIRRGSEPPFVLAMLHYHEDALHPSVVIFFEWPIEHNTPQEGMTMRRGHAAEACCAGRPALLLLALPLADWRFEKPRGR